MRPARGTVPGTFMMRRMGRAVVGISKSRSSKLKCRTDLRNSKYWSSRGPDGGAMEQGMFRYPAEL